VREQGATYFFALLPGTTAVFSNEGSRMKSYNRSTIWRELWWGVAVLAIMTGVVLFVYLPSVS
jgi:hypothetical protein